MSGPPLTLISTRRSQMFATLDPVEVDRLRRFGEVRHFEAGAALVRLGEPGHGLTIILSGDVTVTRRRESAAAEPIVTRNVGSFMGELAQLSGRPALVDTHAGSAVEALLIPPDRSRALLVAEA